MHGGGGLAAILICLFALFWFGVFWVVQILVCWFLCRCLRRIPLKYRRLDPGQVWLLLIPGVNFVQNFVVFPALSDSFKAYLASVGDDTAGTCGKWTAIAYCVSCCLWPLLVIGAWMKTDAVAGMGEAARVMYGTSHIVGVVACVSLGAFLVNTISLKDRIPASEN